jgi:ferredoxin
MPRLTVNGNSAEVEEGKRLVLAIQELGVQIGHRCGGNARCTTCRVEFVEGEPETMTAAEYAKLKERELLGDYRLSCQIVCSRDMSVRPIMTLASEEWDDTGPDPDPQVQPRAEWLPIDALKAEE